MDNYVDTFIICNECQGLVSSNMFATHMLMCSSLYRRNPLSILLRSYNILSWIDYEYNDNDDYEYNMMLADTIGKVEIGLTKEEIDQVTSKIDFVEHTDDSCPICLEEYRTSKNKVRELLCTHSFCDGCISEWFSKHKQCPCCKIDMEDVYLHH